MSRIVLDASMTLSRLPVDERGASLASLDGPLWMVARQLAVSLLPQQLPDES